MGASGGTVCRMDRVTLRVLLSDGAEAPGYATEGSAGMDLRSIEPVRLAPLERKLVRTGLRVEFPAGYELQVRPRSGLALKRGISMVNTPGTIDSDYRGEIGVILINLGQEDVELDAGERIAQMVLCPIARADVVPTIELAESARGEGGFGSTGTR